MDLLWIVLIVVLALALFGGFGYRSWGGRRDAGAAHVDGQSRYGGGAAGLVGLLVVALVVILLVSLLT